MPKLIEVAWSVDLVGVARDGDLYFVVRSEASDEDAAKWETVLVRHFAGKGNA